MTGCSNEVQLDTAVAVKMRAHTENWHRRQDVEPRAISSQSNYSCTYQTRSWMDPRARGRFGGKVLSQMRIEHRFPSIAANSPVTAPNYAAVSKRTSQIIYHIPQYYGTQKTGKRLSPTASVENVLNHKRFTHNLYGQRIWQLAILADARRKNFFWPQVASRSRTFPPRNNLLNTQTQTDALNLGWLHARTLIWHKADVKLITKRRRMAKWRHVSGSTVPAGINELQVALKHQF
jgi:hypothetical protein